MAVRNDDENVLRQPDRGRGLALAGRRVLHRELAVARVPGRQVAPAPRSTPPPWPDVPARFNSPDGQWVGVSARVSVMVYNTDEVHRQTSCRPRCCGLADPRCRGKLALAPERDRLPAHRDLGHPHLRGAAAALRWLRRPEGQRRRSHLPRQRDASPPTVNSGPGRRRASSTSTTGTASRPTSGRPGCTRRWPTSRRATRATSSTSRGRPSSSRARHRADAQRFVAFLASPRARRSSPTATASSTRSAGGQAATPVGEIPLAGYSPTRSPSPSSVTGPAAWPSSKRPSSCDGHRRGRPGPAGPSPPARRRPPGAVAGPGAGGPGHRRRRGPAPPARLPGGRGRPGRVVDPRPGPVPTAHRHLVVEHGQPDRRGHRPVRG